MTSLDGLPKLGIIVASVRPGRIGKPQADWFYSQALADGRFDVQLLDLAEINLPLMDEPNHPKLHKYTKPYTFAWSEKVDQMDAFVIVTSEYNYGVPASLKNALDYLSVEWVDKPVAIYSYGGISGGLRSASHLKDTLQALGMHVVREAISVTFAGEMVKDGVFHPSGHIERAVKPMLDALEKYDKVFRPLRKATN